MKQTRSDSHLEIWGRLYINSTEMREPKDQGLQVIQIEPTGQPAEYIVEIVRKEGE